MTELDEKIFSRTLRRRDWIIVAVVLVALFFVVGASRAGTVRDGKFRIYFLNVGQGDAILLLSSSGHQVLIDGGPDRSILTQLSSVMPFYDRSLDAVILTHPDADHLAGLVQVLDRYDVGVVIETGMACETALCASWREAVKNENAENVVAYAGYTIDLGDGALLTIISPPSNLEGVLVNKKNNGAIVARLDYKNQNVLLTADIERETEHALLTSNYSGFLDTDILKVGHHGSKNSSLDEFLDAITPKLAVIEVGAKNRYGHPTQEALTRLANHHATVYRTDINGRVTFELDGERIKVIPEKPNVGI